MTVETFSHGASDSSSTNGCESRSARLFQCARCHAQAKICSCCDRGHIYCIDCAVPARQEARKEASKRYQLSPRGRSNHAERQRRYRERQRLRKEKVTHQGRYNSVNVLPPENVPMVENAGPELTYLIKKTAIICDYCAQVCSPFLRRDFLMPGNELTRKINISLHDQLVPDTG